MKQGALAGSVCTQHCDDLALAHREGDTTECFDGAIRGRNTPYKKKLFRFDTRVGGRRRGVCHVALGVEVRPVEPPREQRPVVLPPPQPPVVRPPVQAPPVQIPLLHVCPAVQAEGSLHSLHPSES